ncbi:MAG: RagB/SusD family nutrient uptake outer membrane protein, partial [Tannerellaceae bacterium]|nr:RagB/SusD family nutrient uptake outer membrane protein [Tannerellaceae bacterium]
MKKIILFCLSVLFFSSCNNDFLSTVPEDKSTDESFFITENHFRQAIVGIYQPLRDHGYATACWLMGEMRSDNTHYTHYSANRMLRNEEIANFLNTPINEHTDSYWKLSYNAIAKANTVIDRIEGKDFPDEFKNEILGEAKFIRAYIYFELVKYFGGVPLNTHEVKSPEEAFIPRNTVDEVYNQI